MEHRLPSKLGGQIFIDVWGLIAPNNPELAAEFAEKAASVSHDREGIYGGQFIAACIAAAFSASSMDEIIAAGLRVIPADSEYVRVTKAVMDFHQAHPDNWRDCFQFVKDNFGYDRYPGVCHIIPNSAVMVLSLLYGEGDFSKTINICNMCGWDTDCNVGNVGTIMGVYKGLDGIEDSWRKPINDFLCTSSVIGAANITDIPASATYTAAIGYKVAQTERSDYFQKILTGEAPVFHFEYPGSTHAFLTEVDDQEDEAQIFIENSEEQALNGQRSLKMSIDRVTGGNSYRLYQKTYYRPADFNDNRYDPAFSPKFYPGQTVDVSFAQSAGNQTDIKIRLYALDSNNQVYHYGDWQTITDTDWANISYTVPYLADACIEEVGVEITPLATAHGGLVYYLDSMDFQGQPNYQIDFSNSSLEEWNPIHQEINQFTYLRGHWVLEDGYLSGSMSGEAAECYTGAPEWDNYEVNAVILPKVGYHHRVLFRVQGAIRSYAVGLEEGNKLVLLKNDHGYQVLAEAEVDWKLDQSYTVNIQADQNTITVSLDGTKYITFTDDQSPYMQGQIGFGNIKGSRTYYKSYSVSGIAHR